MPFEKGRAKTGGRTKGVTNKTTAIKEALVDFDFGYEFAENYKDLKPSEKMQVLRWVAEYLFVKPKPQEDSGEDIGKAIADVRLLLSHKKANDVG